MENISVKIEEYVGRKVDFPSECELMQASDGSIEITRWAVRDKSQPTMEQLEALGDQAEATITANQKRAARKNAYPSIGDQLDMQYWDSVNDTTTWKDAIASVKSAHPKPQEQSMSTLNVTTIIPGAGTNTDLSLDGKNSGKVAIVDDASVGGDIAVTGTATFSSTNDMSIGGNLLLTTASKGIYLGVTSATAANLLDDYEEGTFTPSVGGNATYNSQIGYYTKIGNSVTVICEIHINAIGTGSTNTITGIPFAAVAEAPLTVAKSGGLSVSVVEVKARIAGATIYYVTRTAASTSQGVNTALHQDGTNIQMCGSYITAQVKGIKYGYHKKS